MFCTNCGQSLETGDNFCGECGKAIRHIQSSAIEKLEIKATKQPVFQRPVVKRQPEYIQPQSIPRFSKTKESKAEKEKEESRAELRKLLEKQEGREVTDQELFEAEHWLTGYAKLVYDMALKEHERKKKLDENPKGFHLGGVGYTCFICGDSVSNEQTWYDKHGIKCLICQSAIDKKIIPATTASDKDSWYSQLDLENSFFINRWGIKRFVKEGLLKPRIVRGLAGGTHCQLFLIKDHQGILPPKELTKWPMLKFQKDGEDRYHSEPWFLHADPKEVLKGYKILEYLQTLKEKETKQSFPDLSFQIPKGARSIMKINHIEEKPSTPGEKAQSG